MSKKTEKDPDILSTLEACKFLGISRTSLYDLVERDRIPFTKIGRSKRGKYLFSKRALAAWFHGTAA